MLIISKPENHSYMKQLVKTTILIVALVISNTAWGQSVIGKWKTIDDETGKAKSVVNIYEEDGRIYGQIIEIFNGSPDKICKNCTGDKTGQKIVGMVIISDLEKDGKYWEGDDGIFDPEKDTYYDVKIWREGDELNVRGYIGFLFRTQTWVKA